MAEHGSRTRLTPEVIVDAAVRISARGRTDALTGRALGEELGVDRSAVWRHFSDKDALLRAVGDRLLTMAHARVPAGLGPKQRMEHLAGAVVAVFTEHPHVGAAIAPRTLRGPGEFALVEMILAALDELGLEQADVVRYQRMMAEAVLSYAGMLAGHALLPDELRAGDERAWAHEYVSADPERYPAIAAHAPALAEVGPDLVLATMIEAFWTALDARVHAASAHVRTD